MYQKKRDKSCESKKQEEAFQKNTIYKNYPYQRKQERGQFHTDQNNQRNDAEPSMHVYTRYNIILY